MTEQRSRPRVSLLVTDLDNTLWDWFHAWHTSFSAMLRRLSELSGVPQAQLEQEMQAVHRERGTTEYSYLLNELPSLVELHPGHEPLVIYDEAIHVLNAERRRSTALYPGVEGTLQKLRGMAVPIVAYTESIAFWTEWRIKATGLDGVIEVLYSSPDHDVPRGVTMSDLRTLPSDEYGLKSTVHKHVPSGILKPSTHVLEAILSDYGLKPEQAVYVGDSLMKDVAMAQQAGVLDVHARYGVPYHRKEYDLLRRVSHWRQEDIDRERKLAKASEVIPSYSLAQGFADLLHMFKFRGTSDG